MGGGLSNELQRQRQRQLFTTALTTFDRLNRGKIMQVQAAGAVTGGSLSQSERVRPCGRHAGEGLGYPGRAPAAPARRPVRKERHCCTAGFHFMRQITQRQR